jgi:multidrug efflux system outer membrane protein
MHFVMSRQPGIQCLFGAGFALPAMAMLASCATPVPQALTPKIVPAAFSESSPNPEQIWPSPQWWQAFGSARLSELIDEAAADNQDLAVATARVSEARAQITVQRSAYFPQLTGQSLAQRASGSTTQSAGDQPNATSNAFGVNIGASYELDVRGLARDYVRAATETLKSARFARETLALTLTANVANVYFDVLTLRERIAIANEDIKAINSILAVIELRVSTGKSSHLDLAQERAQVEAVEAQLPVLEQEELAARIALAVLLGEPLESLVLEEARPDALNIPAVGPGIASDLLQRRPDVAAAEANLASAHANLDAARAAFLPRISLVGDAGYASTAVGTLLRGPSFIWVAGLNLAQTVFDGGKLAGQRRLAAATENELIASYRGAVLNAYADVESALDQVRNSGKAEEHLRHEVDSAREAFDIAQLQYRQGVADLLIVLQTQQTLFGARDQLAQIRLARLQAAVHLYEALGGGWSESAGDRTQLAANRDTVRK